MILAPSASKSPHLLARTLVTHSINMQNDIPVLYKPPFSWELFTLSRQAAMFALTPDFEKLMGCPYFRWEDFDYTVLRAEFAVLCCVKAPRLSDRKLTNII